MTSTIRLSIVQILEALSDTNKFYASRELNKSFADLTYEDMLNHYIRYAGPGYTVYSYDVSQMTFADIKREHPERESTIIDPHKPTFHGNPSERI